MKPWQEVINKPSVNLIIGRRRSGKSALLHYLLEMERKRGTATYVAGPPEEKWYLVNCTLLPK